MQRGGKKVNRVAAYCRVSTDKEDQVNSLENQIRFFTEYIQKNATMQLVKVYYDNGISGTSMEKRESFLQMISDAENGGIDFILTKEVSRFARNTLDTLQYVRRLKQQNIGVIFMNDSLNTLEQEGEFRLTLMASLSQEESRKISERVKWGQKQRMEQGVVFGHSLPGYTVQNGKLILHPEEAEIVKLIFHKYLLDGYSANALAKEFNQMGVQTNQIKKWSSTNILRILKNEKYVGDLCQKKSYTPDFLTHKKKCNRGAEEKIYLTNHHEPIIDRFTWNQVQQELQRRHPPLENPEKYSHRYWCSGKLVCEKCGCHFVSRVKKNKNGNLQISWRCYSAVRYGIGAESEKLKNSEECRSKTLNDKVVYAAVTYCFQSLIESKADDLAKTMWKEIQMVQQEFPKNDLNILQKQRKKLQEKKEKALELALDGFISKEELKQKIDVYNQQDTEIENRLNRQTKESLPPLSDPSTFDQFLHLESDRREIYREMLDKIIICDSSQVTIFFKKLPFGIQIGYQTSGKSSSYHIALEYRGLVYRQSED
jgi:DNA invertase Pin-like site-specific DNA recombinase/ribosomal protein L44E